MEENKSCTNGQCKRSSCCMSASAPFLAGLFIALAFGWWIFPDIMFSKEPQPILFKHSIHVETNNLDCATCHFIRDDGSFSGTPNIEKCAECHTTINTAEPGPNASPEAIALYQSEKTLVEEHVLKDVPIDWQVHQYQPDNVFFSHAAHFNKCYTCHLTMKYDYDLGTPENPEKLCMQCHLSIEELDKLPPVERNSLTDYTKTTLKMWECESCHAHPGHFTNGGEGRTVANNACFTCHK